MLINIIVNNTSTYPYSNIGLSFSRNTKTTNSLRLIVFNEARLTLILLVI